MNLRSNLTAADLSNLLTAVSALGALKTAGKVAQTAGGAAYVLGGKNESAIGGIVGLGGTVANQVAGEGYQVKLKFKCL